MTNSLSRSIWILGSGHTLAHVSQKWIRVSVLQVTRVLHSPTLLLNYQASGTTAIESHNGSSVTPDAGVSHSTVSGIVMSLLQAICDRFFQKEPGLSCVPPLPSCEGFQVLGGFHRVLCWV